MDLDKEFSNICRICSEKQKNVIRIFGEEGKGLYLQAKIRKYLYITVTLDDHFPKVLCESCCAKLNGIHTFATMANRTQDKFGKLFAKSGVADNKNIENHSLLHSYLTKGTVEKNGDEHGEAEPGPENEITEMEVRIDPMLILQCSPEETLSSSPSSVDDDTNLSSASMKSETSAENYTKCRKPYNCSICPRRFISQFALQSHMWSHLSYKKVLSNNDNVLPKKDTQQSCVQSEQEQEPNDGTCDNSGNMRFACPVCGKDISTKGNLKVHLETHRPKGRYGCDICGRVFKTQSNLYRHKEYHGGVQYPCTVCGRVYPTNSTLRAHSITHSDLRPHKCPLCDKTFKRNQDLKFHINQHTGARPYRCPYCPKAFASSGNCFSHRKRMHPLEVERDRERAAEIMR